MEQPGLSMNMLALDLRVAVTRIAEIGHERRAITPNRPLWLDRLLWNRPGVLANLQARYNLKVYTTTSEARLSAESSR